ncbi:hypothetical protein ADIARSV_2458 [Arcticibacter svalbardensis MN12-7]|uniref:Uncharacterized protein n=1 Tax=Arcticibacter svalbardensis MN12-7 TaxID=1150600 RepID=R9GRM4_9SPHI|nr:hypothetical protein ADIARSV_2458 [Arcticibacter svalbardensis MN12-7]
MKGTFLYSEILCYCQPKQRYAFSEAVNDYVHQVYLISFLKDFNFNL